jgi:hypothetical protein
MKKRRQSTQPHVHSVRKFRYRIEPSYGDAEKSQWINYRPMVDKTEMNASVGKIHHPFAYKWNDTIT